MGGERENNCGSGLHDEKIEEGEWESVMRQPDTLHFYFPSASSSTLPERRRSVVATSASTLLSLFSLLSSCCPQMNSMNSVSSSEDIKPPPGLQSLGNINYQCTSPGGMSKHICSICGDRSSGNTRGLRRVGGGEGMEKQSYTPTHHNHHQPDDCRKDKRETDFKVTSLVHMLI